MEHTLTELVVVGKLTEARRNELVTYLKEQGLTVFSAPGALRPEVLLEIRTKNMPRPKPTWSQQVLQTMPVLESIPDGKAYASILKPSLVQLGVHTLADLQKVTFLQLMQPELGLTTHFSSMAYVLNFMIEHGIPLRGMVPQLVFRTRAPRNTAFSTITQNCLIGKGIRWVELIAFCSEKDIDDIRYIGTKSMREIKAELNRLHLDFRRGL